MKDFIKFKNQLLRSDLALLLDIDDENIFYVEYNKIIVIKRALEFTEFEKVSISNWITSYLEIGKFSSFTIEKNTIKIHL
jgi:hypothetical protein